MRFVSEIDFFTRIRNFKNQLRGSIQKWWFVQVCDQIGWAAMLAFKGLTGVAPEVNLRNPLHTSKEALKPGIHPVLETGKTLPEFQKVGYQWIHKKDRCRPKIKTYYDFEFRRRIDIQ